jgi:hypothetical protein
VGAAVWAMIGKPDQARISDQEEGVMRDGIEKGIDGTASPVPNPERHDVAQAI